MNSTQRNRLLSLLQSLSFKEGNFILTSGKPSEYLVDVKRTALHPEGGRLCGHALLEAVRKRWPDAQAVGGRTLGADPLAVSTAQASLDDGSQHLHAFIVRKEPKGHGSGSLIEQSGALEPGAPVVVLEDTSTTGGSAIKAVEAVREAGFSVCGVLTLVDREEGAAQRMADQDLDFAAVFSAQEIRRHAQ